MATPTWQPTVGDVAVLIRARTKDDEGNEDGTFNADTRPTATQVETYISNAVASLTGCTGSWLPEELWPLSRYVISLHAAMHIELSYWPEYATETDSVYAELKALFDQERASLCGLAAEHSPVDTSGADPTYYFGDGTWVWVDGEYIPENETVLYREGRVLGWWST